MDGERGHLSSVRPEGNLTFEDSSSQVTFTQLPIDQSASGIPSVVQVFRQPVNIKAVVLVSPSTKATSSPAGTPATSTPAAQEQPILVTLTLETKKAGDDHFTRLPDGSASTAKVRPDKKKTQTDDTNNPTLLESIGFLNGFLARLIFSCYLTIICMLQNSPLFFLQVISVHLEEDRPAVTLLPPDQDILEGVTEMRITFRSVSDVRATTLELRVLGCTQGKLCQKMSFYSSSFSPDTLDSGLLPSPVPRSIQVSPTLSFTA